MTKSIKWIVEGYKPIQVEVGLCPFAGDNAWVWPVERCDHRGYIDDWLEKKEDIYSTELEATRAALIKIQAKMQKLLDQKLELEERTFDLIKQKV